MTQDFMEKIEILLIRIAAVMLCLVIWAQVFIFINRQINQRIDGMRQELHEMNERMDEHRKSFPSINERGELLWQE